MTINLRGKLTHFTTPKIMGIVNLTPDSFFQGSRAQGTDALLERCGKLLAEGADMLDLGACSTRPGAELCSSEEEMRRLIPAIESVSTHFPEATLSIDTFRADVAKAAVEAGGHIINELSGGEIDSRMFKTVATLGVPYIIYHTQGMPEAMQHKPFYEDCVAEVMQFFARKVKTLREMGIKDIIVDPGFGFGKRPEDNFALLEHLSLFRELGCPVLAGMSRKGMVWKTLGITAGEALNGTTVVNTIALMNGADILRVHDVREAKEAVALFSMLPKNNPKGYHNDKK